MHFDEVKIYEPIENSNLESIIPKEDKIIYSAIFEIFEKYTKKDSSHVILTDKGFAISSSVFIPIQNGCGVKSSDLYYFPWHVIHRDEDYPYRFAIGNLNFRIEANKDLEVIKPIDVMDKEFREISEILIKQSKDALYEKLLPVLKSYPKVLLPSNNTSRFPMLNEVYKELRSRYLKEVRKGKIKPGSKIRLIPSLIDYNRERIIEEIKNFNLEQGSYEEQIKIEEMVIAFANFFKKHSIEEATDLVLVIFEINPFFASKWYSKLHYKTIKRFPTKEKDFYEFEKMIAEQLFFNLIFKDDEYIIVDFKGTVNLLNAHLEYLGHIYLTNYQLIFPNIPQIKFVSSGIIGLGVKAHIVGARKVFANVLKQNPDLFYIKNPYGIELNEKLTGTTFHIKFIMPFNYKDELSRKIKKYKHVISIKINRLKNTSLGDYKQKRIDVVSKFADFFSQLPNTVCPNCSNVQDKSLKNCEKCG